MALIKKYETSKQRQFKQVLNSSIPLSEVEEYEPLQSLTKKTRHGALAKARRSQRGREVTRMKRAIHRSRKIAA